MLFKCKVTIAICYWHYIIVIIGVNVYKKCQNIDLLKKWSDLKTLQSKIALLWQVITSELIYKQHCHVCVCDWISHSLLVSYVTYYLLNDVFIFSNCRTYVPVLYVHFFNSIEYEILHTITMRQILWGG